MHQAYKQYKSVEVCVQFGLPCSPMPNKQGSPNQDRSGLKLVVGGSTTPPAPSAAAADAPLLGVLLLMLPVS